MIFLLCNRDAVIQNESWVVWHSTFQPLAAELQGLISDVRPYSEMCSQGSFRVFLVPWISISFAEMAPNPGQGNGVSRVPPNFLRFYFFFQASSTLSLPGVFLKFCSFPKLIRECFLMIGLFVFCNHFLICCCHSQYHIESL